MKRTKAPTRIFSLLVAALLLAALLPATLVAAEGEEAPATQQSAPQGEEGTATGEDPTLPEEGGGTGAPANVEDGDGGEGGNPPEGTPTEENGSASMLPPDEPEDTTPGQEPEQQELEQQEPEQQEPEPGQQEPEQQEPRLAAGAGLRRAAMVEVTVTVTGLAAGELQNRIEAYCTQNNIAPAGITHLTVTGPLNRADLDYIYKGTLSSTGGEKVRGALDGLQVMDLSGAQLQGMDSFPDAQFAGFKTLQTVALPATGLTSVGNDTFYDCTGLESIASWPEGLECIGDYTFASCTGLTGITSLPSGIATIGIYAFANCTALESVDLSSLTGLASIGGSAFFGCTSLRRLTLPQAADVLAVSGSANYTFSGCDKTLVLVPDALLTGYRQSSTWNNIFAANGQIVLAGHSTSQHTLTYGATGNGSVAPAHRLYQNDTIVYKGEVLTLTAAANPGYRFMGWQATGADIDDATSPTTTFTITGDADITARFALDQTEFTIQLATAGTLQQKIEDIIDSGDFALNGPADITGLTITGPLNTEDLDYIWKGEAGNPGGGSGALGGLQVMDLSGAQLQNMVSFPNDQFAGFETLQTVALPATGLTSVGDYTFYGCTSLTGIASWPDGLEYIGDSTFYGCTGLTSIASWPDGLQYIGNYTFANCTRLTSIDSWPDGLQHIGDSTFSGCTRLTSIDSWPDGLQHIGDGTFVGCTRLASIASLPAGLQSIGEWVFYGTAITSLDLARVPAMVTVHSFTFENTTGVEVRVPAALLAEYEGDSNWQANQSSYGVTFVSDNTPYSLTLTAAPEAGGSITGLTSGSVGLAQKLELTANPAPGYRFMGWQATGANIADATSATTTFTITGDANITARFALDQTEFTIHLATAGTLQQEIEEIIASGLYVVEAPEDITGLTITGEVNEADLDYIWKGDETGPGGSGGFGALGGLRAMDLSGAQLQDMDSFPNAQFAGFKTLQTVALPATGLTSVGHSTFYGCTSLTGIASWPEGLECIGDSTFRGCTGLTGIDNLPDGLEYIGNSTFSGCTGLTSIDNLPAGLQYIGNDTFADCTGLTSIDSWPDGLQHIGDRTFAYCTGLASIANLPAGLQSIGYRAFYGTAITSLDLARVPAMVSVEGNTFENTIGVEVRVPAALLEEYKADSNWQANRDNYGVHFTSDNTPYSLTLTVAPQTGGSITGLTSGSVGLAQKLELTANPAPGYAFKEWQATGANIADASSATTTFTITGHAEITAVFAYTADAETPVFTTQPQGAAYAKGTQAAPLTALAEVQDGGSLTYQWYSSETDDNTAGSAIPGAQQSTYTPATTEVGTLYYYVVATNTITGTTGAETATATSDTAKITITQPGTDPDDGDGGSGPSTQAITFAGVPTNNTIRVGESFTLVPSVDGQTGSTGWKWDSDFFSATFNSPATFTALKTGTSTITYTAPDGRTASVTITIQAAGETTKPATSAPADGGATATGDSSMVWLYAALAAIAALAGGLVWHKQRQYRRRR